MPPSSATRARPEGLRHARARTRLPPVLVLCLLLAGCLAPALLVPSSGQLMWALLKPLVGFDPNQVNLFEQPIVRNRMVALLGPNYDATMQLLHTANELRREGPLFYVVSRYTPVPEIAQKAGLVWNADTNQMAVALMKGDVTEVFAEKVEAMAEQRVARAEDAARERVEQAQQAARDEVDAGVQGALAGVVPVWPAEMSWVNPRESIEQAVEQRVQQARDQAVQSTVGQAADGAARALQQAGPAAAPRADDATPGDPAEAEDYEAPAGEVIDEEEADEPVEAPPDEPRP